jgi:hypothetical protein
LVRFVPAPVIGVASPSPYRQSKSYRQVLRARVRGVPASKKIEFAFRAPLTIRRIAARGLRVPRPDFLAMPFYRDREPDDMAPSRIDAT